MIDKKETLLIFLKRSLKADGFKKSKALTWYKFNDESVCFIVNLQKSRGNDAFYINIGINYPNMPPHEGWDKNKPCSDHSTISCRAQHFVIDGDKNNKYVERIVSLMWGGGVSNDAGEVFNNEVYKYITQIFEINATEFDFVKNYNNEEHYLENSASWLESRL